MYSSSTVLVLSIGSGVWGFTLDQQAGEFLLTHRGGCRRAAPVAGCAPCLARGTMLVVLVALVARWLGGGHLPAYGEPAW